MKRSKKEKQNEKKIIEMKQLFVKLFELKPKLEEINEINGKNSKLQRDDAL